MSRLFDPSRPPCDMCRAAREAKGEEPPCEDCIPPILEENRKAIEILLFTANQLIFAGMGDPVDIDFKAVDLIMKQRGIRDPRVFEKVIKGARHMIEQRRGNK